MSENRNYRTQVTQVLGTVTQADRDDLARAAAMAIEAKRLKTAVMARIRQRRRRARLADGGKAQP